jgi:hypothetical protein
MLAPLGRTDGSSRWYFRWYRAPKSEGGGEVESDNGRALELRVVEIVACVELSKGPSHPKPSAARPVF